MSTIVIHGTLAREQPWWRVERPGGFLDHLGRGMQLGGFDPDVWMIGGRHVSQYEALQPRGRDPNMPFQHMEGKFSWWGSNADDHRRQEGERLARYLETLSSISPNEPIDIVAHSHGCNLVKIATNFAAPEVRFGRMVFLAAPHCEEYPLGQGKFSYRLNARAVCSDAGGPHCVLNLYSAEDPVQTDLAAAGLVYYPAGTPFNPIMEAYYTDPDPDAQFAYDNFHLETRVGRKNAVHSMMHSPTVGLLVGFWLARWPEFSGEQCQRHFGIDFLTDTDTG